nr:uncharacterized protein LOC128692169 [Cherax quadricarinatus]
MSQIELAPKRLNFSTMPLTTTSSTPTTSTTQVTTPLPVVTPETYNKKAVHAGIGTGFALLILVLLMSLGYAFYLRRRLKYSTARRGADTGNAEGGGTRQEEPPSSERSHILRRNPSKQVDTANGKHTFDRDSPQYIDPFSIPGQDFVTAQASRDQKEDHTYLNLSRLPSKLHHEDPVYENLHSQVYANITPYDAEESAYEQTPAATTPGDEGKRDQNSGSQQQHHYDTHNQEYTYEVVDAWVTPSK